MQCDAMKIKDKVSFFIFNETVVSAAELVVEKL